MITFVDKYRSAYGVEPICKMLPIVPSTYHAHVHRRINPDTAPHRVKRDAVLVPEVQRVFDQNFGVYGVRKVWRQLLREGFDVARCTVERLMKSMGLQGVIRGKRMPATVSDKSAPCPLDHVNRQFKAPRPNVLWVSDFTYVSTWTSFVYVAFVIDAYARRVVGWRVGRTAHAGFVLDALEQAFMTENLLSTVALRVDVSNTNIDWSTTRIVACSTFRSNTPSGWPRPAWCHPSAVLATATTMLSPKR